MGERDPFVGIRQTGEGSYTLGLIRDDRDQIHEYKMFVIESKFDNWSPGDIKVKFSRLDVNGLGVARFLSRRKIETGLTFQSRRDALVSINAPYDRQIILIKVYPNNGSNAAPKSGSAWYVGNHLFVSNAHVVEGAREIDLIVSGRRVPVRVAAVDKRIDLAVLRSKADLGLTAIPVNDATRLGEKVTVIGYPLGNLLGTRPKVTDGVLSGLSGLEDDPTRYTISAPIQPGNSGGPLFGNHGYAIGVAVSKLTSNKTDNIGFAIKAQYLLALLQDLGVKASLPDKSLQPDQLCEKYCGSVVLVQTK